MMGRYSYGHEAGWLIDILHLRESLHLFSFLFFVFYFYFSFLYFFFSLLPYISSCDIDYNRLG